MRFRFVWMAALSLAPPVCGVDVEAVRASIVAEMKAQPVPGAFAAIVAGGRVVLAEGFGVTSAQNPVPVTSKTLFRLGSTAKVFTALAAVRLARDGKVDLRAPVGIPGPFAATTLHQLLSHTAGLADDAPQDGPHDESALQGNVASWDESYRLAPPGRLFSYANTGYVLAGAALEKATGQPFASVVAAAVFQPLGMTASTYRPFEAMLLPLALPHGPDGKLIRPFPDHAGAWPPGSAFSNAEDLAKFLAAALPPEIVTEHARSVGDNRAYGYGVSIAEGRLYHTGARAGYGSRFEIFPAKGVAVFLGGNRTGALFPKTAALVRAQLAVDEPAEKRTPAPLPPQEARALAGRYTNRALRVELALQGDALHLKLAARTIPVQKLGPDRYHIRGGAQLETFRILRDADGNPEYLCAEVWCLKRSTP